MIDLDHAGGIFCGVIIFREKLMAAFGMSDPFDLHLVDDFFNNKTCCELIAELSHSPINPAVTYGQDKSGVLDERVRRVSRVVPSAATVQFVRQKLDQHRDKVCAHFGINLTGCEDPQFLCYRVGDFFVAHQDGNTGLVRLKSDAWRRVSVSIFLNQQTEMPTMNSYCGGSLVFSNWRTDSKCVVRGETGKLVAFRSETTHEVTPVTHGERYSIVSWFG